MTSTSTETSSISCAATLIADTPKKRHPSPAQSKFIAQYLEEILPELFSEIFNTTNHEIKNWSDDYLKYERNIWGRPLDTLEMKALGYAQMVLGALKKGRFTFKVLTAGDEFYYGVLERLVERLVGDMANDGITGVEIETSRQVIESSRGFTHFGYRGAILGRWGTSTNAMITFTVYWTRSTTVPSTYAQWREEQCRKESTFSSLESDVSDHSDSDSSSDSDSDSVPISESVIKPNS